MFTRNPIRQITFGMLIIGLIGFIALASLFNPSEIAASESLAVEITPELTAQPELLPREVLIERAFMVAQGAGKVDAESASDLDASLGVYTTGSALNIFDGGSGKVNPKAIGAEYFYRPLFIMPIMGSGFQGWGGPPRPPNVVPPCYTTYVVILFADTGDFHGEMIIPEGVSVPDLAVLRDLSASSIPEGFISHPNQAATEVAAKPKPLPREVLFERALMIAQEAGTVDAEWGKDIAASFGVYITVNDWKKFNGEALVPASAACLPEANEARRTLFVMPFAGSDFEPLSQAETPTLATEIAAKRYTAYIVVLFADDGSFYGEKLIAEGHPLANLERLRALNASFFYDDGYGE